MDESNEKPDLLRELLDGRAPRDVVKRSGITLDDLRKLNDMVGEPWFITEPGELIEDPDGIPLGVSLPIVTHEVMSSPLIGIHEFRRLGADPDDFPNLTCYDPNSTPSTEDIE